MQAIGCDVMVKCLKTENRIEMVAGTPLESERLDSPL